jgi:hypothetical protein
MVMDRKIAGALARDVPTRGVALSTGLAPES